MSLPVERWYINDMQYSSGVGRWVGDNFIPFYGGEECYKIWCVNDMKYSGESGG